MLKKQVPLLLPLLRTYATYTLSLVLTSVLLWLLVDWMGLSEWISPIIVLMTTVPINFVINKFWTFK
ncbi:GtrA family protein [Veillonella absiana]